MRTSIFVKNLLHKVCLCQGPPRGAFLTQSLQVWLKQAELKRGLMFMFKKNSMVQSGIL